MSASAGSRPEGHGVHGAVGNAYDGEKLMSPTRHATHHTRFYAALAAGALVWASLRFTGSAIAPIAAGDVFFALYLFLTLMFASKVSVHGLRRQANVEDEGLPLIMGLTVAAVVLCLASIFSLLGAKASGLRLAVSLASVPLGWLSLHTLLAFHYARLYYGASGTGKAKRDRKGLVFPGTDEPDAWDFLYFSFVLGMTAQVSDVVVESAPVRRLVLVHSIGSFFFNTVLVALAVNVAVNAS